MATEITLEDVYMITIRNTDAEDDCPVIGPFQQWLWDNKIYSIRGTMATGPHYFTAAYPIKDREAILNWFMDKSWE